MREEYNRILTWMLALALVASVIGVIYVAVTPQETTEPYTEFYILGTEGNASDFPTNLSVGETGRLIVGITNHEHERTTYTVVSTLKNRTVDKRTVTVADERTWEKEFSFTPESPGEKRLQILLYKGENVNSGEEAYRRLRLFVNVSS